MPTSSTTTPSPSFPGSCNISISGANNPNVYIYENGNASPSDVVSTPGGSFTFLPNKSYLFSIKQFSGAAPGAYSFSITPTSTTTPYPTPLMGVSSALINKSNGVSIVAAPIPLPPLSASRQDMVYAPELNMWVVVSGNISAPIRGYVQISNDEGNTWYFADIDNTKNWLRIAYGLVNGTPTFIAMSPDTIAYSYNGINYTSVAVGSNNIDIGYGNGTFIINNQTRTIYRSTDGGLSWQTLSNVLFNSAQLNVYGGGKWICYTNRNLNISSDNGTTWAGVTLPGAGNPGTIIVWDGSRFVCVTTTSPYATYTSTNGTTWTAGLSLTNTPWRMCVNSGITYVLVAGAPQAKYSNDGFISNVGTLVFPNTLTIFSSRNPPTN
jgi:hypothetical protein